MKKIISVLLAVLAVFSIFTVSVFAEEQTEIVSETTEYFEDGSYMVTTIEVEDENSIARATSTKTGSKTVIFYNADDEKMVTVKLTATFSYTGSSATCTNVSPTFTVHNTMWRVTKATGTKSGNKGIGEFTVKKYVLGILTQQKDTTITITCSNTGTLS